MGSVNSGVCFTLSATTPGVDASLAAAAGRFRFNDLPAAFPGVSVASGVGGAKASSRARARVDRRGSVITTAKGGVRMLDGESLVSEVQFTLRKLR